MSFRSALQSRPTSLCHLVFSKEQKRSKKQVRPQDGAQISGPVLTVKLKKVGCDGTVCSEVQRRGETSATPRRTANVSVSSRAIKAKLAN